MDDKIQGQIDQIVEDEVRRGFKVLDLPKDLQAIMTADRELDSALPAITQVRFTKLTPRKRRLTNEAVVKRYHADLQNKDLLSMEQLRRINIERGEWSAAQEARITELQGITGELARDVISSGHSEAQIGYELNNLLQRYATLLGKKDENEQPFLTEQAQFEALERFKRWYLYDPEEQAQFDALYGNGEKYNADADYQYLTTVLPTVEILDVLTEAEELRDTLNTLKKLLRMRKELVDLQIKQAKMFADCVEQRRDQAEEYARLYYTTERMEGGKGLPLAKSLEDLWTFPEEVVSWLLTESYFFLNGIPDSVRPYLEQLGFLVAPREQQALSDGSAQPSAESPEELDSKPDSPQPTETPVASLV